MKLRIRLHQQLVRLRIEQRMDSISFRAEGFTYEEMQFLLLVVVDGSAQHPLGSAERPSNAQALPQHGHPTRTPEPVLVADRLGIRVVRRVNVDTLNGSEIASSEQIKRLKILRVRD